LKHSSLIPAERIEKAIYLIRGEKVMLDRDLADLYGVPTKAFNQAVKRHKDRFPPDFMFQLTEQEAQGVLSRSQSVTLKRGQNIKYWPYAFTEPACLLLLQLSLLSRFKSSIYHAPLQLRAWRTHDERFKARSCGKNRKGNLPDSRREGDAGSRPGGTL
jgi:hypothetical protein